jgi:hypothetical protein
VLANDRACTPLPPLNFHGKEGIDGSSPSEGLQFTRNTFQRAGSDSTELFGISAGPGGELVWLAPLRNPLSKFLRMLPG